MRFAMNLRPAKAYLILKVVLKMRLDQRQRFSVATETAHHQSTLQSGNYENGQPLWMHVGEPVLVQVPKPARDETAACTLWDVSRKLTGVTFVGLS